MKSDSEKLKIEDLKFKAKLKDFEKPLPVISIDFFLGYVSVSEKVSVEVHSVLFEKVEYIIPICKEDS